MITPMNISVVKAICSWRYESPYDVYNYTTFEEALQNKSPLLQDENKDNYLCFWSGDTLAAYINIYQQNSNVFIGIALSPDHCGKGFGKTYLKKGIETAKSRHPDKEIWIQVRSWNVRAVKCYESCGFAEKNKETIKDRFGNDEEFVFMMLEEDI